MESGEEEATPNKVSVLPSFVSRCYSPLPFVTIVISVHFLLLLLPKKTIRLISRIDLTVNSIPHNGQHWKQRKEKKKANQWIDLMDGIG